MCVFRSASSSAFNVTHPSMVTSCRRDMNPSLQPSLSELIQQQQQQNQIRAQQTLNNDLSSHHSNSSSNNDTNNNLNTSLNNNPNNNLIDHNNPYYVGNQSNQIVTPNSLNLGAMDIEYFDQFDFALPSASSQLSVPNPTSLSSMNFDSSDQQLVNSVNSANGIMASTGSYYPNNNSNVNNHVLDLFNIDDFKMSGDSLSWNEVDYAV